MLEVNGIANDSLVIGQTVLEPERSMPELKQYLINTEKLSEAEANDIFGAGNTNMFPVADKKEHWTAADFPGHKILFYNDVLKKKLDGKFGMYNPLYFSPPVIRRDRKYAFIQVENSHEGGALHIYKCENEKWFFYKSVPLYLTD